jgi:hypothetical protein
VILISVISPLIFDIPSAQKYEMIFQIDLLVSTEESILYWDSPTGVANKEVEI